MTAGGAGLGMDPFDLLFPENRLLPSAEPHTIPVARCDCGNYGCGMTDVRISREPGVVHWDWLIEAPINRRVTFDSVDYARELERVTADSRWETADRTAGRLVL